MYNIYWLCIILVILLILLLILSIVCKKNLLFEKFAEEEEYTTLTDIVKPNVFFHKPYTYNYSSAYKDVSILDTNDFLGFMCFKLPSTLFEDIDNDPIKTIKDNIDCKTIQLNEINKLNPKENLINKVYDVIKLNNSSIIGPVYIVIIQYPNKFLNGSYVYSQFNISDKYSQPYMNDKSGTISFDGDVDVQALLIMPMYKSTLTDNEFVLIESENNITNTYNLNGIINMLQYFDKYSTKEKNCFIHCNNSTDLYCGCGSRKKGDYESYCKDDKTEDRSQDKFATYGWLYRINELNSQDKGIIINKINLTKEDEIKISDSTTSL